MTNTELKNTASLILAKYRQNLLNVHPFIGSIAMNLNLVPIRDVRCNTAMTDGKNIFFDIDFLSKLNENEGTFVLGHEVWHVVMMHFLRGERFDHNMFNIATDMEVNQIMESDGFIAPLNVIFPNKNHSRECQYNFPDGLSAEEYYDLLIKFHQHNKNSENNEMMKGNAKGKKSNNALSGQFDDHFDPKADYDEIGKEKAEQPVKDKYGTKTLDPDFVPGKINEKEAKEMAEEVRQMIVSAAQTYERTKGELPGHIKKIVSNVLEAKMTWKEILANFITKSFDNRANWNIPNRRFVYSGVYLPGHTGDSIKIAIGIDTSGSCQEELNKFLSEVSGIAKSFNGYELHVIQCDTEVKDYQMFNEFDPIENHINDVKFHGGGGTQLKPIFDYIQLNDIEVSGVLMFTDGYCEKFEDDGSIDLPIMWALTNESNTATNLKIGEKIYLK